MVKLESSEIVVWMMLTIEEELYEDVEAYDEKSWQVPRGVITKSGYLQGIVSNKIMLDSHENSYMWSRT